MAVNKIIKELQQQVAALLIQVQQISKIVVKISGGGVIPGLDGDDAEEPIMIMGPQGIQGIQGPAGPSGGLPGPPGFDGENAEEPLFITILV